MICGGVFLQDALQETIASAVRGPQFTGGEDNSARLSQQSYQGRHPPHNTNSIITRLDEPKRAKNKKQELEEVEEEEQLSSHSLRDCTLLDLPDGSQDRSLLGCSGG